MGLEEGLDPEMFRSSTDRIWRLARCGSEEGSEITVGASRMKMRLEPLELLSGLMNPKPACPLNQASKEPYRGGRVPQVHACACGSAGGASIPRDFFLTTFFIHFLFLKHYFLKK